MPDILRAFRGLGRERCLECGAPLTDPERPTTELLSALLFLAIGALVLGVQVVPRLDVVRRCQPTTATVVRAETFLESAGGRTRYGMVVEVELAGGRRVLCVSGSEPGEASLSQRAIERLEETHQEGAEVTVYLDPARPQRGFLDPFPSSWWIVGIFLLTAFAVAQLDTLAELLAAAMRHHHEHSDARHALANFDADAGLERPQWLGPRAGLFALCAPLLAAVAAGIGGSWTWLWLVAMFLLAPVPWVMLFRWARRMRRWATWREQELVLEGEDRFAPGRCFRYRVRGRDPRPATSVRLRAATLQRRHERCDGYGVWQGEAVSSQAMPITGDLIEVSLPAAATRAKLGSRERERWTLELRAGSQRAYFDLDFAPSVLPEPLGETPSDPRCEQLLREVREQLGKSPRAAHPAIPSDRPSWLEEGDDPELEELLADQELLYRSGRVVWGSIVQANMHLFEPGDDDHPAAVIYSLDDYYDGRPAELRAVAGRLFAQKRDPTDRIACAIADECDRLTHRPLPEWLAGPRVVYYGGILFPRAHLPDGYLRNRTFLPFLVAPRRSRCVLLVPGDLWPDSLLALWRGRQLSEVFPAGAES